MTSTSDMMCGWLRMREMGTEAVGIRQGASGVVALSLPRSLVRVCGIWVARKSWLSEVRRTEREEIKDDLGSVCWGT